MFLIVFYFSLDHEGASYVVHSTNNLQQFHDDETLININNNININVNININININFDMNVNEQPWPRPLPCMLWGSVNFFRETRPWENDIFQLQWKSTCVL